jgi:hypothetical protein
VHKPSFDPDSPDYSNDDPDWDGHEQFRVHTVKALEMVENLMDDTKVTAWSEQRGYLICKDCATDAKEGGARLTQTTVVKGRLCEWCGQEIGSND